MCFVEELKGGGKKHTYTPGEKGCILILAATVHNIFRFISSIILNGTVVDLF